jgi:hypothetical protein
MIAVLQFKLLRKIINLKVNVKYDLTGPDTQLQGLNK